MKIFKLMAVALVAMIGLNSCSKDCDHDFIEVDYSQDIIGTWTCLEADFAQAFVFKADGSAITTGIENGEYWEDVQVNWKVENNKLILSHKENTTETLLELIPGKLLSITGDKRRIYQYCDDDLSEEIVGMWVCTYVPFMDADMAVNIYQEDGKAIFTGLIPDVNGYMANVETTYKVIGDLMIQSNPLGEGSYQYLTFRLKYTPNANQLGDMLTNTTMMAFGDQVIEMSASMLRIKQNLDLAGKKYDYIKTFVSNVDGLDKDIEFMGYSFNFAKMDGVKLDKMLKTLLFAVEFPDAETIKYSCYYNGENMSMEAPIAVEGNKMTVKMSEKNAAYRDIDLYTFQDQDNTQMHMYMPTYAFINFFGNMQATIMSQLGQLDLTDADAVKAVFDSIDEAVNTINVSFVMTKAAK